MSKRAPLTGEGVVDVGEEDVEAGEGGRVADEGLQSRQAHRRVQLAHGALRESSF